MSQQNVNNLADKMADCGKEYTTHPDRQNIAQHIKQDIGNWLECAHKRVKHHVLPSKYIVLQKCIQHTGTFRCHPLVQSEGKAKNIGDCAFRLVETCDSSCNRLQQPPNARLQILQ